MRIKSRGIEIVQKIFPTWIGGCFARRHTTEYRRSPALSFFKNSRAHFLCSKIFSSMVGIFDLRTVEENNGEKILKMVLKTAFSAATTWRATRKTFLPEIWTKPLFHRLPLGDEKVLWRFFHKRLNFTPLKFRISERCFSDRWFFARKCPNR